MAKEKELEIVYSTRFQLIGSVKLKGWCVHMVCLQGEGFFTYDGRPFHMKKHDAVVINAPQQVHITGQSEDLEVEVLTAPLDFLSNQLPANNYGIGGGISLYRAQNEAYKEVNGEKQRKTLPVKELCVMAASGRAKRNVYMGLH